MNTLNRTIQPRLTPFALPFIHNPKEVKHGLFIFDKPGLAVFKLDIIFFGAGLAHETKRKSNQLCLDLLFSGTSTKNAFEINEAFDLYGAYIQTNFDYHKSTLTIYGLTKYFNEICTLLHEVINDVIFSKEEFDLLVSQKISNIKTQEKKTSYQSRKLMNKEWFGANHPLGKGTELSDYHNLSLDDIKNAYVHFKQFFIVLTTGDEYFSESNSLYALFSKQLLVNKHYTINSEPINKHPHTLSFFQLPDAKQSSICIRLEVPGRNNKDYAGVFIANLIFGGYFGSRLMKNIREDKGWTYGMYSYIKNDTNHSYIEIAGDIKEGVEKLVIEEIKNEVLKLQTILIDEEEYNAALNYFFGQQQESFDNIFNLSDKLLSLSETNNDLQWFNKFYKQIKSIDTNQLKAIYHTYFKTDSFIITCSGSNSI